LQFFLNPAESGPWSARPRQQRGALQVYRARRKRHDHESDAVDVELVETENVGTALTKLAPDREWRACPGLSLLAGKLSP
jgi:hypothetical protein